MLKIIEGDLFDAQETYLVHQCNCVTNRALHLAKSVFQRYPYADVYSRRANGLRDTLGTFALRGNGKDERFVVAIFGQYYPGISKHRNDTPAIRKKAFSDGLQRLKELEGDFAFPWRIGCGAAGGNWDEYLQLIKDFAEDIKDNVTIYRKD